MDLGDYHTNWFIFKARIEKLAKDRCVISNKNWKKLKEIHFYKYLKDIKNPFGYLIRLKIMHHDFFNSNAFVSKVYNEYATIRNNQIYQKLKDLRNG